MKSKEELVLAEYLMPDNTVKAGYRPYAGQFIGFLQNAVPVYHPVEMPPSNLDKYKDVEDLPGEWLYFKIYCIESSADKILAEIISPFIAKHKKHIQKWFFIRYYDPEAHLRFRIHVHKKSGMDLIAAFKKYIARHTNATYVKDLLSATYKPERERYGIHRMHIVEQLFGNGSILIIKNLAGPAVLGIIELAFITVWHMLRVYLGSIDRMPDFCHSAYSSFSGEFSQDKASVYQADLLFREYRTIFENMLQPGNLPEPVANQLILMVNDVEAIAHTAATEGAEKSTRLLADLIHMQMNRNFQSDQRKMEMLVYYLIYKFSRQLIARDQKKLHRST